MKPTKRDYWPAAGFAVYFAVVIFVLVVVL